MTWPLHCSSTSWRRGDPLWEIRCVAVLRLKVRRIAVENAVFRVILLDEILKILVFNDQIGKSPGTLSDQMEESPDVTAP